MKDIYTYKVAEDNFGFVLQITDQVIVPYTRQTQMSKWKSKAAQKYNKNQKVLNQIFEIIKNTEKIPFYDKSILLTLSVKYEMLRDKHSNNHKRIDTSNIFKAVEDAMQGIFFENDTQVYNIQCSKEDSDQNIITISLTTSSVIS
jgi:Holliday junction resolvase RusA-like endonuclease